MKKILRNAPIALFPIFLAGLFFAASCGKVEKKPIRILVGGIAHESNTFNPVFTTESYFTTRRGESLQEKEAWAAYLKENGVEIIPTLYTHAGPFGVVAKSAYEGFKNEILDGLKKAGPLDGIYLIMHGAMHVEGYEDAQADFIQAIRGISGEKVLIAGSFDLHGNMSDEFVKGMNILTGYRTAPHIDGAETRLRAVKLLLAAIKENQHPVIVKIDIPVLIPGEKGITAVEPLKSLYVRLPEIGKEEGLLDASIFVGMPWTDVKRNGMSVHVVAKDPSYVQKAKAEAGKMADQIWEKRKDLKFDVPTDTIEGAIKTAMAAKESTVFISDSGDNTTAGATGDNPGVLGALLAAKVKDAVFAGIVDAPGVEACEKAGVGAKVNLEIGGTIDKVISKPMKISGKVLFITPAEVARKAVVVEVQGVQVVLLKDIRSFTAPKDFKEVNIDPLAHKIVVVKLGYLFQELRDIAPRTIMALTPGFANQVIESLPYKNTRRPIYPLDPDMTWTRN